MKFLVLLAVLGAASAQVFYNTYPITYPTTYPTTYHAVQPFAHQYALPSVYNYNWPNVYPFQYQLAGKKVEEEEPEEHPAVVSREKREAETPANTEKLEFKPVAVKSISPLVYNYPLTYPFNYQRLAYTPYTYSGFHGYPYHTSPLVHTIAKRSAEEAEEEESEAHEVKPVTYTVPIAHPFNYNYLYNTFPATTYAYNTLPASTYTYGALPYHYNRYPLTYPFLKK